MIIGIGPSAEEDDEVGRLIDQLLEMIVLNRQDGILPTYIPGRLAVVYIRATLRPGDVLCSSWSQAFPDLAEPTSQMLDVIDEVVMTQALCLALQQSPQGRWEFAALGRLGRVDQHRDYRHMRTAAQGEVSLLDYPVHITALLVLGEALRPVRSYQREERAGAGHMRLDLVEPLHPTVQRAVVQKHVVGAQPLLQPEV